jgi:hypothetical protein
MTPMFTFTLNCALNEMYATPFDLQEGVSMIEATSKDAKTVVVLCLGDGGALEGQHILLQVSGADGEQIHLPHVRRGGDLCGLRVLRHNPCATETGTRNVRVTCSSLYSLVAELADLRYELDELKTSRCCSK